MAGTLTLPQAQADLLGRRVSELWSRADQNFLPDASVPEIVVENRRQRAISRIEAALVSRGSAELSSELQSDVEDLLRRWAERAYEDAFAPVQDFEIRCARDRDLVMAEGSGDEQRVLDVLERDYRERIVAEFGQIELRGVQVSHRVRLDLKEVYIPLHVEPVQLLNPLSIRRVPVEEALAANRRIVIVGGPGSGKSTLVQALATTYAQTPDLLPFIVVARQLSSGKLPPEFGVDVRVLTRALRERRAVLFVDGLDEASTSIRESLVGWLTKFSTDNPETSIVLTTRPTGSPGEMERCVAGFQAYRLADLTYQEVGQFVDKWCLAAEQSAQRDALKAAKDAALAAEDLKSRIARTRAVRRIAVNPLLTTILCIVHRFLGRTIPEHRITLYEWCTNALLYEWDRAKFPEGSAIGALDAQQKRTLLRGIASRLHDSHEAEISREDVVKRFGEVLPELGRPADHAAAIVEEIRDRSGLLVEKREGYFAFSHLTFQEYLAALDFVASGRVDELVSHREDPWWHEVIALAAGSPGVDSGRLISKILDDKRAWAIFLAASCMETAIDVPVRIRTRVERAIKSLIPPTSFVAARRLAEVGPIAVPALIDALRQYDGFAKAYVLRSLSGIDYEPAIQAILKQTDDTTDSGIRIGFDVPMTMGDWAAFLLLNRAQMSRISLTAFERALIAPRRPIVLQKFSERIESHDGIEPDTKAHILKLIREAIDRAQQTTHEQHTETKPPSKSVRAKTTSKGKSRSASAPKKRPSRKPRAGR